MSGVADTPVAGSPAVNAFIVGAGPVGLASACMLRDAGLRVVVADAGTADRAREDSRVIALSAGSRDILRTLQAWPASEATPIGTIHISQRGHFGRTELRAADYGLDALGHVARAGALVSALQARAQALGVDLRYGQAVADVHDTGDGVRIALGDEPVQARVLVWCEGRIDDDDALSRSRDYAQHAVIALATPATAHGHVAYERFTPDGPVALLPCGRDYAVVYTCPAGQAEALRDEPDAQFMQRLHEAVGGRVTFTALGPRAAWPLALRMRADIARGRQVWLGNAAQTLHPVAGQGLNLALRDVGQLGECLLPALARDEAAIDAALARYARLRRADRIATGGFTDFLARAFTVGAGHPLLGPLAGHARGAALALLDACPPARQFIGRRMMFGARGW